VTVRRRRAARLAALLALAAVLAPAGPAAGRASATATSRLYLDGDSLALGTGLFLPRYLPGWRIEQQVDVSRHAYQGAAAIEARRRSLPRVVVVNLGTNDDPRGVHEFASDVRRVVRAAGPGRCVVWATIVRPPYAGVSYEGLNRVLFAAARRWPGFHVFDWRGLARAHPGWFGADGVHPSIAGYRLRARALARFVRAACAS